MWEKLTKIVFMISVLLLLLTGCDFIQFANDISDTNISFINPSDGPVTVGYRNGFSSYEYIEIPAQSTGKISFKDLHSSEENIWISFEGLYYTKDSMEIPKIDGSVYTLEPDWALIEIHNETEYKLSNVAIGYNSAAYDLSNDRVSSVEPNESIYFKFSGAGLPAGLVTFQIKTSTNSALDYTGEYIYEIPETGTKSRYSITMTALGM